jgi:carbamoyltransferase
MSDEDIAVYIGKKIAENYTVGWFEGRMEFGPRALGGRSILGNAAQMEMKDILNRKIKKREPFRPFAPMVLEEKASLYFDLDVPSPFMLLAPRVKENMRDKVPAITHVDGTARVQTVNREQNQRIYRLIEEVEKHTGVAVIINTSFNRQEPIVCSPEEAVNCYLRTQMDYLVMGNYVVERKGIDGSK